ncbi:MAG: tetratricopeptide repeat protein [Aquabacterium sp.]
MAAATRGARHLLMALALALAAPMASAQTQDGREGPVVNSRLDAPLFFHLLIGEMQAQAGEAGSAYEMMLDAARRSGDAQLYQRAVEIALQSRAGEQALAAAQAWRRAQPAHLDAMRFEAQILLALGRGAEVAAPLSAWLAAVPATDRPGLIAALPRMMQRLSDRQQAARTLDQVLTPYRDASATRTAVRVAMGRQWLTASDPARALELARQAQLDDPDAPGPVLLALDLMPSLRDAESLVTSHLRRPHAGWELRMSYVRTLIQAQRFGDAARELEVVTTQQPGQAVPWLSLGALRVEMRQPEQAEAALQRYLSLAVAAESGSAGEPPDPTQARLLLAQAAEMRGDLPAAERWLAAVDDAQRALEVQVRRATLLARQGQVEPARRLIRSTPERSPDDARAKLIAEAQLLREMRQHAQAIEVFKAASLRFPDDTDLLYEQAMTEEKLDRMAEMERLLRRVIELKPDHAHAHNALGYSLADRRLRLPEARSLIQRALELAPGDPFIIDSLGWVEYRMGNLAEAVAQLRLAYSARPDTEIAAHLGEVLWVSGQQDEARRIWADARLRDAANEVLKETLARLKVGL